MTRRGAAATPMGERAPVVAHRECICCGSANIDRVDVLPPELVAAWELAPEEIDYVNRQQGLHCRNCGATLRCWGLAAALMRLYRFQGLFAEFVRAPATAELRILEINAAGALTRYLAALPRRTLVEYPAVEMAALPFVARSFDLVVHADTLEHVPDPVAGLAECRRVLDGDGVCAFTAPVVVGRLTRSRAGLPASFHGTAAEGHPYLVHSEFGADVWTYALRAGFAECRAFSLEYPAAVAWLACK